jgi:hypothetical protein
MFVLGWAQLYRVYKLKCATKFGQQKVSGRTSFELWNYKFKPKVINK